MPLDLHLSAVLKKLATSGRKHAHECSLKEARDGYLALTYGSRTPQQIVSVKNVQNVKVQGGAGMIDARVYWPETNNTCPTIVFFHGGGFVLGNLDTHDNMCREICHYSHSVVVSIDYRLAPENPFPAALEDALEATKWVIEHSHELGGSNIIAVAGDSAGGNLAAVVTQQLMLHNIKLAAQLLIYPALEGVDANYPSRIENAHGYFLEKETYSWFFTQYIGDWQDIKSPLLTPINTPILKGLPPTVIVTAEFDPLRDEAEEYGQRLLTNSVNVDVIRGTGMIHGFFDMGRWSPAAQQIIRQSIQNFREKILN